MISYKELKCNLKKNVSVLPSIKIALLGDTSTQFLATSIKGWGVEKGYQIDLFLTSLLLAHPTFRVII